MTEHAAVVFVFFFLAEYGSIVLMCILTAILFLGGYLYPDLYILEISNYIIYIINNLLNIIFDIIDIIYYIKDNLLFLSLID
jgi:NADH-ubiquinone oxidoreductase chain 1